MAESAVLPTGLSLPAALRDELSGYTGRVVAQTKRSLSVVSRWTATGRPDRFLKVQPATDQLTLNVEAERLRWCAGRLPVPDLLAVGGWAGHEYLLISALRGCDAAAALTLDGPAAVRGCLREALALLATIPIEHCPFRFDLDRCLADLAGPIRGLAADDPEAAPLRRLLATLTERPPVATGRLQVSHGDLCLPNLVTERGRLSGFIDLAALAVADPARDAATLVFSCRRNVPDTELAEWRSWICRTLDVDPAALDGWLALFEARVRVRQLLGRRPAGSDTRQEEPDAAAQI